MPETAAVSSASIIALKSSLKVPLHDRIRLVRQTVSSVEQEKTKCIDRLCRSAREVLASIIEDPQSSTDQLDEAAKLKARLRSIDPRRHRDKRREGTAELDLTVLCTSDNTRLLPDDPDEASDPWLNDPPLPGDETFRLIDIDRSFCVFRAGQFVLREGCDAAGMIEQALGGRSPTIEILKRLHFHLENSFVSGGPAMMDGPLYSEVTRILREHGALSEPDPTKHFGLALLQELRERD